MIPKVAHDTAGLERDLFRFQSAREACHAFLAQSGIDRASRVLLPAYFGWSPKEGSGVFEPFEKLGWSIGLYRVDDTLHIDVEDLARELRAGAAAVMLIHYFGHVDPSYREVVRIAREAGALVIEDSAHAMLTDLLAGACGRLGDVSLYSMHKVLPMARGGALAVSERGRRHVHALTDDVSVRSPWSFDLAAMAAARRANARLLSELLAPLAGHVDPLWPLVAGEVPQTFPVLIRRASRDQLYERMNRAGFGVVSLYHTLAAPISHAAYPSSVQLARTMMNLPVHQEATETSLRAMVDELGRQVRELEGG